MELVSQNHDPGFMKLPVRRICSCQQAVKDSVRLLILIGKLCLPIEALVSCHRRVGSAMILQIQLAHPGGKILAVLRIRLQLFEEVQGRRRPRHGKSRNPPAHAPLILQLLTGRSAAAVSEAIAAENLPVQILVRIPRPCSLHLARVQVTVICSKVLSLCSILNSSLMVISCRNKMRQRPCSINTFPQEGIIGHLVGLVPADLRCHEVADAAQLHDLRQSRGIAEDVRKPQNLVILSKFLPEEPFSI